jgi:hypothetical protein
MSELTRIPTSYLSPSPPRELLPPHQRDTEVIDLQPTPSNLQHNGHQAEADLSTPPDTTPPTLVQTIPEATIQPSEKFNHSQSYISWFRKNRSPALKEHLKDREIGKFLTASAAVGVDYLSTNISDTDLYGKYTESVVSKQNKADEAKDSQEPPPARLPQRAEALSGSAGIMANIEAFSDKFKDVTYVPSQAEYREMLELASHISTEDSEEQPEGYSRKFKYFIKGENPDQINPYIARSFLDATRAKRWQLSGESIKEADKALHLNSLPLLKALQSTRQRDTRSDFLNYDDYAQQQQSTEPNAVNMINQYHGYLKRRVELDSLIRDIENRRPNNEIRSDTTNSTNLRQRVGKIALRLGRRIRS